jgi:Tol biopolymer transport system component
VNADGSDNRSLTGSETQRKDPAWSPDGTKIAFGVEALRPLGSGDQLFVMNADGSDETSLATSENINFGASDPESGLLGVAWSPDGNKIAFSLGSSNTTHQIYVMNADGSGLVNVSNHVGDDYWPAWSPDGTKIVFNRSQAAKNNENGKGDIWVMNANGSGQTQLTSGPADDTRPAWR